MIRFPATYIGKQQVRRLPVLASGRLASVLERLERHVVVIACGVTYFVEDEVALTRLTDIRAYLRSNASALCPFPGWQALFVANTPKSTAAKTKPRTQLSIWFYDPAIVEAVTGRTAVLVIPEELALARQSERKTLYLLTGDSGAGHWVYARSGQLLTIRSSGVSTLSSDTGSTLESDIHELSGVAPEHLATVERDKALMRGIKALSTKDLIGLLKLPTVERFVSGEKLKRPLLLGGAAVIVWLAGTSAVIKLQHDSMQRAMDSLSGDLKAVLVANQTEQQLRERSAFLLPLVNAYPHASDVFLALSQLNLSEITVSRIGLIDEQLLITGEAPSASALLAEISSQPWVADASFSSPVARRNGIDRFVLVVELKKGALVSDASA